VPGKAPSCARAKLEAAAPSPLVGGVLRATKLDRGLISKFQNASLSHSVTCGNIFPGEILHLQSFDMRAFSLSALCLSLGRTFQSDTFRGHLKGKFFVVGSWQLVPMQVKEASARWGRRQSVLKVDDFK
jgi:hypothetical protein